MIPELKVPFLKESDIEHAGAELLRRYAKWKGAAVRPPINIDNIIEGYFGLDLVMGAKFYPYNAVEREQTIAHTRPAVDAPHARHGKSHDVRFRQILGAGNLLRRFHMTILFHRTSSQSLLNIP